MFSFPKRPLNQVEGPVYPDFKAALPKFRWSGNNWKADAGLITRDLEHNPGTYSYAVLVQPRDYNSRVYGIDSGRDAVNHNVRYPLIRLEDRVPLSRLPRPLVIPRLNPTLSGDGGQVAYGVDNTSITGMTKFLTDRVKGVGLAPRAETPFRAGIVDLDLPLPDLEVQLSKTNTGSTGIVSSVTVEPEVRPFRELFTKISSGPLDAGSRAFEMTDLSVHPTPVLESKTRSGPRSAGITPLATFEPEVERSYVFESKIEPRGMGSGTRVLPGDGPSETLEVHEFTSKRRPVIPYTVPGEYTKVEDPSTIGRTPFFRQRHAGIVARGWVETGGARPRKLMSPQIFGLAEKKRGRSGYSIGRT